jgi:hypothetical protein
MKSPSIIIAIAGMPVAFSVGSQRMLRQIRARYRGYVLRSAECFLSLECFFGRESFCKGEDIQVSRLPGGAWSIRRNNFECRWEGTRGTVRLYPSIYAFDGLLRVVLSVLAAGSGKIIMHAAAVGRKNQAFVFPGVSGSGKTTVCRLLKGMRILNDELVCLGFGKRGRVEVWGTPFWGELGNGPVHRSALPLRAVLFLKKEKAATFVRNIDPVEAVAGILRCCCVFGTDQEQIKSVFERASAIAAKVSCRSLHFQKDAQTVRREILRLCRI